MRTVIIEYLSVFKVLNKLTKVDVRVVSTLLLLIYVCVFRIMFLSAEKNVGN
jgi:hypothetical protein